VTRTASLSARVALALCAIVLSASTPATAQEPEPRRDDDATPPAIAPPPPLTLTPPSEADRARERPWSPRYVPEVSAADWVGIGAGSALALGSAIASPQPKHWYGGIVFDEKARDALRMPTAQGRYTARDASDVGLSLLATWPFLIDALMTAWYANDAPEIARRMAIIDAEALVIVGGVQEATTTAASRERPYARNCGGTDKNGIPEESVDCQGNIKYRSFFSGHAALSFTGAGLLCVHHLGLGLLGSPGDAITCATGYAVATSTAVLRVMGDMHYMTDVITGAAVGSLVGVGLPLLRRTRVDPELHPSVIRLELVPIGAGLGVGGLF
jgi:membrane-associated phospholipid phosphatase